MTEGSYKSVRYLVYAAIFLIGMGGVDSLCQLDSCLILRVASNQPVPTPGIRRRENDDRAIRR